jgi:putative mRNA 3-end processing factor
MLVQGLLTLTEKGLYCPRADLFIDPWYPAGKALITHGHSDHARWGQKQYIATPVTCAVMAHRLGSTIVTTSVRFGEIVRVNGVEISFHPAGHIPGSAQIRLCYRGETWVVSGDYKLEQDGVSEPFEPVSCQHFISECTFGLPVFRWQPQQLVANAIHNWWSQNAAQGNCSILLGYALGKAQRLAQMIQFDVGPVYAHGAVYEMHQVLQAAGVPLKRIEKLPPKVDRDVLARALVLAPPGAEGTPWMKKFLPYRTGMVSGWMQLRGNRRRRAADAGFVLSDHADWSDLNTAIQATGAEHVYLTHGYKSVFARHCRSLGRQALELDTLFEGDNEQEIVTKVNTESEE